MVTTVLQRLKALQTLDRHAHMSVLCSRQLMVDILTGVLVQGNRVLCSTSPRSATLEIARLCSAAPELSCS